MLEWTDAWIENGRVLVRFGGRKDFVMEVAKVDDLVRDHLDLLEDHVCHAMCQLDLEGEDDGQVRSGDQEGRSEGEGGG